jgi:hypothetical protein
MMGASSGAGTAYPSGAPKLTSGYLLSSCCSIFSTKLDVNLDVAFHPLLPSTVACCGWNGFIEMWH